MGDIPSLVRFQAQSIWELSDRAPRSFLEPSTAGVPPDFAFFTRDTLTLRAPPLCAASADEQAHGQVQFIGAVGFGRRVHPGAGRRTDARRGRESHGEYRDL